MIEPRPYQQDAVNSLFDYYAVGNQGNPVIAMPTASGKSIVIAKFCHIVLSNWPRQRIMVATHVKELIEQNFKKMLEAWPEAPAGIYSAGLGKRETIMPIIFGGVQSMVNCAELFGWRDLLLVDEAHLISGKDDSNYGNLITALRKVNPNLKVIGLSATPWRTGQGRISDGPIFTDICFDLTSMAAFNKLIEDGYLCTLIPKRTTTELHYEDVGIQNGDYKKDELQIAVNKDATTHAACREIIEQGFDRNSWLIFASGIEHADNIAKMMHSFGIDAVSVHSKISDEKRDKAIRDFKSGKLRCVVNNNVLTTGFDHPGLDLIGMLRPTVSTVLWCLDTQTEILTKDGFKPYCYIFADDLLASINPSTNEVEYVPILDYVFRPVEANEDFVSYKSPQLDIRVTANHKMLIRKKLGRAGLKSKSQLIEASKLIGLDRIEIPVSGIQINEPLPLSEADLRFIGLFMTDGTLDKGTNKITIYQSERYPAILSRIRETLVECGFKFSERIRQRNNPRYFAMHRFCISYGKPRLTDKHLTGWSRLATWLSKDFALALMNVSEKQFDTLLEAIYWGDGQKQPSNVTWTQRSYHIGTGNTTFLNRLQQVALVNGWRANIVRGDTCWMIRLKKQQWNVIQKSNDGRPIFEREAAQPNEMVWCVENRNSTIFIRRNGKVAIVGNCQMLGRGTRPAPGKANCLVLDFAGNTKRLGPINDPVIPKKRGEKGGGVAPVRICEECGTYNHARAVICINCGHKFENDPKITKFAGTDALIKTGDAPVVQMFDVQRVIYHRHQKGESTPVMQVSYFCGLRMFNEFICLEHSGFAGKKARDWWRQRILGEPPKTVDEALKYVSQLKVPSQVRVWVNRKWPEIMATIF